jgi:putative SOS response-associated peptidase YedK
MATVPANALISPITDRMPAIMEAEDWATWLGERPTTPDEAKAVLKTMEGVRWQMTKEPPKPKASKATKPDPEAAPDKPKPAKLTPEPGLF